MAADTANGRAAVATRSPFSPSRRARAGRTAVERAAAAGMDLVVAAVVGPNSTVLAHPVSERVAHRRAA